MCDITIERATKKDIDQIMRIAEESRLGEMQNNELGFLVSAYDRNVYADFISESQKHRSGARHVWLLVAKDIVGDCVGFLLAYDSDFIKSKRTSGAGVFGSMDSSFTISNMLGSLVPFVVIKQVAVTQSQRRQGVGRRLYENFFDAECPEGIGNAFAAIVVDPENAVSEGFHASLGFLSTLQSSSRQIGNSRIFTNQVWHRPTKPNISKFRVNDKNQISADNLNANLENAYTLYMHEDDLNWKKMSFMVILLFAQIAAYWAIAESAFNNKESIESSLLFYADCSAVVVLAAVGFLSINMLIKMIDSGRVFMATHKGNAKIMEAQLRMRNPNYIPIIWGVPAVSNTVRFLKYLPRWALFISVIAPTLTILILLLSKIFL